MLAVEHSPLALSRLGAPLWVSIATFAMGQRGVLFALRPMLVRGFRAGQASTGAAQETPLLLTRSPPARAVVEPDGEVWTARTREGDIAEDAYATVVATKVRPPSSR